MLNQERRREILELLHSNGRVLVRDLAKHFRISLITIRKDLEVLHENGHLQRAHGGAVPRTSVGVGESSLEKNKSRNGQQKSKIAQAAAQKIRPGQVIILDSRSIIRAVARACASVKDLTVITNATSVAAELADSPVDVILTGGHLNRVSQSFVGPLAEESLRKLSADMVFLGVDGFDISYGLTTPSLPEARVNAVTAESARRVVAVCDSSNFGRRCLSLILPTSSVQETITDGDIARRDLRELQRAGVEVTLA
jgi:DeoR family transcriptional regulator, aga operon transcriptional repressor